MSKLVGLPHVGRILTEHDSIGSSSPLSHLTFSAVTVREMLTRITTPPPMRIPLPRLQNAVATVYPGMAIRLRSFFFIWVSVRTATPTARFIKRWPRTSRENIQPSRASFSPSSVLFWIRNYHDQQQFVVRIRPLTAISKTTHNANRWKGVTQSTRVPAPDQLYLA